MVGEDEVHAAAVDVEVGAEVLPSHGGALAVPSREAVAPGAGPAHDVLRLRALPQGEVGGIVLLLLTVQLAGGVEHVVEVAPRELAVVVVLVILCHVEVDRALALVGIAVGKDFLDELYLLDDVSRREGFDARREDVQLLHGLVVAVGIELCHFHRLELLQPCLLGNLVLSLVGVVLQVSHVGDVADVAHLVPQVLQVAEDEVERDGRARMPQVGVTVDGGTTDVHAHMRSMQGNELLLLAGQCIVDVQFLFHRWLCLVE